MAEIKMINARSGLRLRAGPGTDFETFRLLPYGAVVSVLKATGAWSLVDLQGDGASDGYVSSGFLIDEIGGGAQSLSSPRPSSAVAGVAAIAVGGVSDKTRIPKLIEAGNSAAGLAAAATEARAACAGYPHNGCAAHLSALLRHAGIDVQMTLGAGKLAHQLEQRGWQRVAVGAQQPGDVGVAFDNMPPDGADHVHADHVYLVISVFDGDRMMIADNQNDRGNAPHERYAMAGHGKPPTDYFLRAV